MKGSIDSIKCMFIDLLAGRERWGESKWGVGEGGVVGGWVGVEPQQRGNNRTK